MQLLPFTNYSYIFAPRMQTDYLINVDATMKRTGQQQQQQQQIAADDAFSFNITIASVYVDPSNIWQQPQHTNNSNSLLDWCRSEFIFTQTSGAVRSRIFPEFQVSFFLLLTFFGSSVSCNLLCSFFFEYKFI